jgi:hypothetical protein
VVRKREYGELSGGVNQTPYLTKGALIPSLSLLRFRAKPKAMVCSVGLALILHVLGVQPKGLGSCTHAEMCVRVA